MPWVKADKDWLAQEGGSHYKGIPAGKQNVTRSQADYGIANGLCTATTRPKAGDDGDS